MKRASRLSAYKNAKEFAVPDGLDRVEICTESGKRGRGPVLRGASRVLRSGHGAGGISAIFTNRFVLRE